MRALPEGRRRDVLSRLQAPRLRRLLGLVEVLRMTISQSSFLGFTTWTVDAIAFTAIYLRYPRRDGGEALLENTGDVTVTLRTNPSDSAQEGRLISGGQLTFKTDGPRGITFGPDTPICHAKATSGTSTLVVTEK